MRASEKETRTQNIIKEDPAESELDLVWGAAPPTLFSSPGIYTYWKKEMHVWITAAVLVLCGIWWTPAITMASGQSHIHTAYNIHREQRRRVSAAITAAKQQWSAQTHSHRIMRHAHTHICAGEPFRIHVSQPTPYTIIWVFCMRELEKIGLNYATHAFDTESKHLEMGYWIISKAKRPQLAVPVSVRLLRCAKCTKRPGVYYNNSCAAVLSAYFPCMWSTLAVVTWSIKQKFLRLSAVVRVSSSALWNATPPTHGCA